MTLVLDDNNANFQVQAFEPGQIKINEKIYTKSVIITANKIIDNWQPQSLEELKKEHLLPIEEIQPSILIIGVGEKLAFPNIEIYGHLINKNIGVEIMDTRAASRTYNALTAESRNVAAALILK